MVNATILPLPCSHTEADCFPDQGGPNWVAQATTPESFIPRKRNQDLRRLFRVLCTLFKPFPEPSSWPWSDSPLCNLAACSLAFIPGFTLVSGCCASLPHSCFDLSGPMTPLLHHTCIWPDVLSAICSWGLPEPPYSCSSPLPPPGGIQHSCPSISLLISTLTHRYYLSDFTHMYHDNSINNMMVVIK